MANTKQARKRARQTVARNLHLAAQRSQYRTAVFFYQCCHILYPRNQLQNFPKSCQDPCTNHK